MLRNLYCFLPIFLTSIVQVLGQDLYNVKVNIDTFFVTSDDLEIGKCQNANFKVFYNDSMAQRISDADCIHPFSGNQYSTKQYDNAEKVKGKIEVHLKAEFKYLFYWSDEYIYSLVYEDIDTIQDIEGLNSIHSDTIFKYYQSLMYTREVCGCGSKKEGREQTILLVDSLRKQDDTYNDQLEFTYNNPGVYWIWSSIRDMDQPIFLIIDRDENILMIKPLKYWVHFNAFKASNFKKKAYGQSLQYDAEDEFYIRSPLSKYLIRNYFYLIAEGEGSNKLTQSSKWKMFFDYNAFGNFKCMLPNTIVPSKNIFCTPKIEGHGYEEVSKVFPYIDPNDSLNTITVLSTSLGFVSFQLIEKISCTGIYRIHAPGAKISSAANSYDQTELEPKTVNNLKYLPGIYFMPRYFEVNTINGLSKEEFIKNQCKN